VFFFMFMIMQNDWNKIVKVGIDAEGK